MEQGIEESSGLAWFSMDYVSGRKATEHLALADREELEYLAEVFLLYLQTNLKASEWGRPPLQAIDDKVRQLLLAIYQRGKIKPRLEKALFEYLCDAIPDVPFPKGFCHGDLTLSNILFHRQAIYLIDFLDSFLDSPVIDLVKLRQDTRYYWTWLLDKTLSGYDASKAKIALGYLDQVLCTFMEQDERLVAWHDYLAVMNMARILPYAEQPEEIDFLTLHLEDLLKNRLQ